MMFNDVTRAYFGAPVKMEICFELPKEDWIQEDGSQDLFGQLQKSLYGIRDVASNFQAEIKSFIYISSDLGMDDIIRVPIGIQRRD